MNLDGKFHTRWSFSTPVQTLVGWGRWILPLVEGQWLLLIARVSQNRWWTWFCKRMQWRLGENPEVPKAWVRSSMLDQLMRPRAGKFGHYYYILAHLNACISMAINMVHISGSMRHLIMKRTERSDIAIIEGSEYMCVCVTFCLSMDRWICRDDVDYIPCHNISI